MYSILNLEQLITLNGVPNAHGKFYVFKLGRTELADIWYDPNGETILPNPLDLDNLGMGVIYVSNLYDYTVVCCDPYNNELFSRDIYVNSTGEGGNSRLYEGLDPICVNNEKLIISAKKATLSVQDPLYFVEDSPTAVCIGLQESAYSGLPYIENSAIELDPSGNISAISGYPFHSDSADNATSAESAGIVTDGWETGSDGRITAYNGTAFSAGKVYSGISPVYVDNENDQIGVSSKDFLANSPLYFTEYSDRVELSISGLPPTPGLMYESGFNYESGKITGYNGSGISAGKVYSGLAPITVDNEADTISLASAILGVQSPLFFVEDSETATIIGLDSAQIQIDIPESANWNEAYSTVNNNSGNWQSAADELAVLNTAKWEGAADTLSSHSADWNNKLDSNIYAEDSGTFLTALPSDVVYTADIQDMATTGDINDLVTSIAETYQTKTDMTGYLTTGDSSNFYTTANESGFITGVDLTDYATKDFVNDNVASSISGKLDIATYSSESGNFLTAHQDLPESADWNSAASAVSAGYANWNASYTTLTANSGNWDSTYDTVSNNSASWTGGATPTYAGVDGLISAIDTSGLYAVSAGTAASTNRLLKNGTMGYNITQVDGSNNFLYMPTKSPWTTATVATGIFSPLQYATGACLAMDAGSFKAYYKGNEWFVTNTAIGQVLRGEVHNSRGVHISGATTAGYGFNLGTNAVSGVNIFGSWKYSVAEDAALRAVSSCDMHESAFGYDASNNITAYNGSAFKAGGDVPTGVMIESALEYNAVNEISGYNGSAFATEAHQKQWIIHDDTLLHEANSAQYALGVNVSAVAQLMGVDETVLWSGTAAPSNFPLTMSEPFSAFEKIEFVWDTRYNGDYGTPTKGTIVYTDNHGSTVPTKYTLVEAYANASQTWWDWWYLENDNNGTTLSNLKAIYYPMTGGNSAAQTNCRLYKVVGIGRKN